MIPAAGLTANALLRGLLGTSSPAAQSLGAGSAAQAGEASFASLLAQAREGGVQSGMPVTIARDAGVQLSSEQLSRLASAADIAEAHGATRAVVAIDGKMLTLDVASRQITSDVSGSLHAAASNAKSPQNQALVLADIDAFIRVPSMSDAPAAQSTQNNLSRLQSAASNNASLLNLLTQQTPSA